MLAVLNDVLGHSMEQDFCVPAFNIFGYEDAKAVVDAAEEMQAPVILAANKAANRHMPISVSGPMLAALAETVSVPVVVHLDHGANFDTIVQAIKAGYSSVMYDGSQLPFEENIRKTKDIIKLAHAYGIQVEAEIGSVAYSDIYPDMKAVLTEPAEAEEFAERTGVDALAVAVGTVHRMHDQAAEVRFELIEEIQKRVSIPLVMHGATGIPDNDLRKLTKTGFGKVNIGTALRMAFGNTMRREFAENPRTFDRLELLQKPMNAVKQEVMHKMKLLNTDQYNKLPN